MSLFSERFNLRPKKIFQLDGINHDLKIALWNIFYGYYLSPLDKLLNEVSIQDHFLFEEIFTNFFKMPLDRFEIMSDSIRAGYIDHIKDKGFFLPKLNGGQRSIS